MNLTSPPPFPSLSVAALLATPRSSLLLASSGKEYSKPVTIRTPIEMARARKEAMGRLGLDFLSFADDADADMDWEKELADSGEPDSPTVEDTECTSTAELDRDIDVKPPFANINTEDTLKAESLLPSARHQGIKSEDSPMSSPGISTTQIDNIVPSVTNAMDFEPQGELSARERNRLKRKRKVGASAFVVGSSGNPVAATGNGHINIGPSGPPPPPKSSASKYGTVAVGEKGASK